MSVSDTIPIQLHNCEAYIEDNIIHIRPKIMDRLLSEVAPSHDSPSSNNSSRSAQPELQSDPDSPGQMIREAEQFQQERMSQFEQSQFSDLANFTQDVLDSALADSTTTVSVYTTQTSPITSVPHTPVATSSSHCHTPLVTSPISPADTIILPTDDQTRNAVSTDSPNNSPVGVSDVPVILPDTSDVPTVSAQTLPPSTTLNANFFDSQASSSTTRLTTTEVVYTQGQIKFTFTTPTSTLTPNSDYTKIMQMADIYESQNQIQKTMFENIALNRLLENDHTMWNAITYVKGKIQHAQQILRPQYIPFQPSRFAGPYYSSYRVPFTPITRPNIPSPPPRTTPSEVLSVPSPFSSRTDTPPSLSVYTPPSPVPTPVVQLKRVKMSNSEINIQQIDQTPSKKKFITKPIPPSKFAFKHKAASTASMAATSSGQNAPIYEAESSPSSSSSSQDDPSYIPGEEYKLKQKYEKYQKLEPKTGKKSSNKKKHLKSKSANI